MNFQSMIKIISILFFCIISSIFVGCDSGSSSSSSDFTLTSAAVSGGLLLDAYKCETKVNDIW